MVCDLIRACVALFFATHTENLLCGSATQTEVLIALLLRVCLFYQEDADSLLDISTLHPFNWFEQHSRLHPKLIDSTRVGLLPQHIQPTRWRQKTTSTSSWAFPRQLLRMRSRKHTAQHLSPIIQTDMAAAPRRCKQSTTRTRSCPTLANDKNTTTTTPT